VSRPTAPRCPSGVRGVQRLVPSRLAARARCPRRWRQAPPGREPLGPAGNQRAASADRARFGFALQWCPVQLARRPRTSGSTGGCQRACTKAGPWRARTDATASRIALRLARKSVPSIESTCRPGNERTSREMSPPGVWHSTGTEIAYPLSSTRNRTGSCGDTSS